MIGRADIEESKSKVAKDANLPQTSYPCGNFSITSKRYMNNRGSKNLYMNVSTYIYMVKYKYIYRTLSFIINYI